MSRFSDRVNSHVYEACQIVSDLCPEDVEQDAAEVDTIVRVLNTALARYDPAVVLHVTSALYVNTLLNVLQRRDEVA